METTTDETTDEKAKRPKRGGTGTMIVGAGRELILGFVDHEGEHVGELLVTIDLGTEEITHGAGNLSGLTIEEAFTALKLIRRIATHEPQTITADSVIEHYHDAMASLKYPVSFGQAVRASADLSKLLD